MLKQRITRSQSSEKNLSPFGESNVDSENPTHLSFNDQNQESADLDKTIENQNNQNKNNVFDENQTFLSPASSHMRKSEKKNAMCFKKLKTQNQLLQLKFQMAELSSKIIEHCWQHNDDHHRNNAKKKTNHFKKFKKQKLTNYKNLITWLRDCENYIFMIISNFTNDKKKFIWTASFLFNKIKTQWRIHANKLKKKKWIIYVNIFLRSFKK